MIREPSRFRARNLGQGAWAQVLLTSLVVLQPLYSDYPICRKGAGNLPQMAHRVQGLWGVSASSEDRRKLTGQQDCTSVFHHLEQRPAHSGCPGILCEHEGPCPCPVHSSS